MFLGLSMRPRISSTVKLLGASCQLAALLARLALHHIPGRPELSSALFLAADSTLGGSTSTYLTILAVFVGCWLWEKFFGLLS